MQLIDFEKEIFDEAFKNDGLLIMAKGLGLEKILITMIKLYCEQTNLVLILNINSKDEEYIMDSLKIDECKYLPKSVNSDISVQERISIYMNGGVIFVTNRILVVDLLVNRIPSHLITGIIVFRAHKVIHSCQESFILRLYRERNKVGFIKAFSDSPISFTRGYCLLDRTLKSLFLKNIFLWPRFRDTVVACCDKNKIDVIELHIPMTKLMKECQSALLDIISDCIKELKLNSHIKNLEEINLENATLHSFDQVLRHHLDPIWHQLSSKIRQIVVDLKTLRELLQSLTQHDCLNFNRLVSALRSNEEIFKSNTGWLFTESAEKLIEFAKQRTNKNINEETGLILEESPKLLVLQEVLQEIRNDIKTSFDKKKTDSKKSNEITSMDFCESIPRVFIVAQDEQTCDLISKFLCNAPRENLKNSSEASPLNVSQISEELNSKCSKVNLKNFKLKSKIKSNTLDVKKLNETNLLSENIELKDIHFSNSSVLHSTLRSNKNQQSINIDEINNQDISSPNDSSINSEDNINTVEDAQNLADMTKSKITDSLERSSVELLDLEKVHETSNHQIDHEILKIKNVNNLIFNNEPRTIDINDINRQNLNPLDVINQNDSNLDLLTIIHPMYDADDPYKLRRMVDEISPEFVIFYDANVILVRQLEVFKASNPNQQLRAYFLIYGNSIEEQRYLTTLSNEQKAFEYIIQEKATMVIPEEREGRDVILRDLGKSAAIVGNNDISRLGGGFLGDNSKNFIIVDMREFRSELPSLLHRRGIDVQPLTIQVGDYILTPEICVERKSVSDLIGSLHNGRLYTQCVSMCRTYKKAILLIEFDPSKPFLLQDRSTKQGEIASHDIISRLVLLTLHFPKLFIIWSQSPFVTAEIFEDIKENRDQPNAEDAMAISGSDPESNSNITSQYNPASYDMLLKLPGITHRNCHLVLRNVKDLHELSTMSVQQLKQLLGNDQQAQQLHDFMHMTSKCQAYLDAVQNKVDNAKRKIPAKKKYN